jgi:hypothetical protein
MVRVIAMLIWARVEFEDETIVHDMGESAEELAKSLEGQMQLAPVDPATGQRVASIVRDYLERTEAMDRVGDGHWIFYGDRPRAGQPLVKFSLTIGRGDPPKVETKGEARGQ